MLTLTRKTHYALIALTHLALAPEGRSSARQIAASYRLPLPLLMNLLKQLTQQELVRSVRGPHGGYTLSLPPGEITLTQVVRAVEGPIHVTQCVPDKAVSPDDDDAAKCVRMGDCPIRSSLERVHNRMIEYLDSVTLADVISNQPDPCRINLPATGKPGVAP
jgi:Rrf2 family protein